MSTIKFIKEHPRFLFFAICLTFFSSYGQSFFFGIYNKSIRETFSLSSAEFGALYGILTLTSAFFLSVTGRLIDRLSLPVYVSLVLILLSLGCLSMGLANHFYFFVFALFLTRFSGQGLMSHAASTSMAKYFEETRGRAIAIGRLGHHAGEIFLPPLALYLMSHFFWQTTWIFYASFSMLILLPFSLFLLRGHKERHESWLEALKNKKSDDNPLNKEWTQKMVLSDWRFYLIVPVLVAEPMINTGIFFHSERVASAKGWELNIIANSFSIHALTTVFFSLIFGYLIDKGSSRRLLVFLPLPLSFGMALLSQFKSPAIFPFYMFFSGISKGMLTVISSSLWAELYGLKHLGAIKALFATIVVISTAIMPALLGYLFDQKISMEHIAIGLVIYLLVSSMLARKVSRN